MSAPSSDRPTTTGPRRASGPAACASTAPPGSHPCSRKPAISPGRGSLSTSTPGSEGRTSARARSRCEAPMVMTGPWLLYGANGYTGELVARLARGLGHRPILAGRNADGVCALSEELGLDRRLFSLDAPGRIDDALAGMSLVLHCAGPFSRTSKAMADACLRTRTHYLDVTGEVEVFEALAARDAEARASGVMLLPGCGFDVVPSDCLAVHLKRRMPEARRLALAYGGVGRLSRGTATTAIEGLGRGGLVRRGG